MSLIRTFLPLMILAAYAAAAGAAEQATLTTLVSFSASDGYAPLRLVETSNGEFYGITLGGTPGPSSPNGAGGGSVFKMTRDGKFTTLAWFSGDNGVEPNGLVQGADGNFYGTTLFGKPSANAGTYNGLLPGTVFRMTPEGVLTTLVQFDGRNGTYPFAGVVEGLNGTFYGTTYWSEAVGSGFGRVFKVTREGDLTILFSFNGANGANPSAELLLASDGNFYGTTRNGGLKDFGTVFKLTPNGVLTTLASFADSDGAFPESVLVEAPDGNFYGTTGGGGLTGQGALYKVTPTGSLTRIVSLVNGSSRVGTLGGKLAVGHDGNLYGSFFNFYPGGIFRIAGNTLAKLVSFNGVNGGAPSELILGEDGDFYGTTIGGGSANRGTVFRLHVPIPPVFEAWDHLSATWAVTAGAKYQVQSKTDLVQTEWSNSGAVLTATTSTLTLSNAIGSDPQRFYRLLPMQ